MLERRLYSEKNNDKQKQKHPKIFKNWDKAR